MATDIICNKGDAKMGLCCNENDPLEDHWKEVQVSIVVTESS